MPAALLLLADRANDVSAGAWLTLVLPLVFLFLVLGTWWFVAARGRRRGPE
jgi:hypothetical protein